MHIVVVGLNYHKAPVEIREKFVWKTEELNQALIQLKETTSILECVIVSTCNRTEIYAVVDKLERYKHYILSFMEKWFHLPRQQVKPYLFTYTKQEAVDHLLKVVTGLDSLVIGETQILGQVRNAFLLAQKLKATGVIFNRLFKQAITFAKRVHYETAISESPISVSTVAVELGKRVSGSYVGKKVMIIGAGKMSELTIKYFADSGVNRMIVVNRTLSKANELANKYGGEAYSFERLPKLLEDVDVVISCTSADGYVITLEMLEAVEIRRSNPLFLIDIAVPRDIDPAVSQLANVHVYNMDDLEAVIDSYLQDRRKEADKILGMISGEIEAFEAWMSTLGVSPIIQALQTKSAMIHEETLLSLLNKLPELDERQIKIISKLTKSIINQMLRDPILRIKEMSVDRNRDEALDYFTQIFALEEFVWSDEVNRGSLKKEACIPLAATAVQI